MTYEQGIRIATRTFAAYLLVWAVADTMYLPREFMSVTHEFRGSESVFSAFAGSYFARLYIMYLAENVLRIALLLLAAGWFYRCTPHIHRFFTATDTPQPSNGEEEPEASPAN
jgi:hypothetical protein